MAKHERWQLQSMQAADLNTKILLTKSRIREWIKAWGEDGVYVSFSGGKDSTVLLDIVRQDYPDVPALFVDVPTQYPELKQFATSFKNVDVAKPQITFMQVCEEYGFPLISKEVSGTVEEAKKYLTEVANSITTLTDRQTDRQTVKRYWAAADILGIDRRQEAKESQEYQDLKKGIIPSRFKYGKPVRFLQLEGKLPEKKRRSINRAIFQKIRQVQIRLFIGCPF